MLFNTQAFIILALLFLLYLGFMFAAYHKWFWLRALVAIALVSHVTYLFVRA